MDVNLGSTWISLQLSGQEVALIRLAQPDVMGQLLTSMASKSEPKELSDWMLKAFETLDGYGLWIAVFFVVGLGLVFF